MQAKDVILAEVGVLARALVVVGVFEVVASVVGGNPVDWTFILVVAAALTLAANVAYFTGKYTTDNPLSAAVSMLEAQEEARDDA